MGSAGTIWRVGNSRTVSGLGGLVRWIGSLWVVQGDRPMCGERHLRQAPTPGLTATQNDQGRTRGYSYARDWSRTVP